MIDVLKRLADLDAKNPNIVKESQVQECGPMGIMGGMPEQHHTPASINMTADSGPELTGMLRDIMQLAGLKQVGPQDLGVEPDPMSLTAEPVASVGPMAAEPLGAADDMRAVLDKLNPEPAGDEQGDELGPFQGNGGDDTPPFAGNDQGDEEAEDDEEETDEGEYDNSPADAEPTEPFDSNEYAHQENQPGTGDDSEGKKRQSNLPTATFENLMKEYKSFIGESEEDAEDDDMEEGIEDRLKDLDPKNPVNIPAYQRKAASGDSASAAKNTKESVEETADILKLAGLAK